jgi:single-stranded DNA-binding protein
MMMKQVMQMLVKLGDSVIAVGTVSKDAEFKNVGDKQTAKCSFSLAAGKRKVDGEDNLQTIWVTCVCWRNVADTAREIIKGDVVFAIGKVESREYNGKEYNDLVCEFISVMGANTTQQIPNFITSTPEFEEIVADDELPF